MKQSLVSSAILIVMAMSWPVAAQADTLKKIEDSASVVIGVRESSVPLSYALGDGKYGGYHVEICQKLLSDIQKQLGLAKLDVKFQPVSAQNRIPLVQNGTVDLECGSTTNNAARQKDVAFAVTTFVEEVRFAVKANSGIASIEQLAGRKVATTTGTTSVQAMRKNARARGIRFDEVYGRDHAESFKLLESGRADAFVMDGAILAGSISRASNPADFNIVGEVLSVEPIAIMLRRDDPAFKAAVDGSIKAMMSSGAIARLWDKWFLQPIPPNNTSLGLPASDSTKAAWANPNDRPMEDYPRK